MYRKILVALENDKADSSLLPHVAELAKVVGAELVLLHVADGWAARNFDQLKLAESEEIKADRVYLETTALGLREKGLRVQTALAMGNPPQEILKISVAQSCDLIAMASHGHKLIGDIVHGSTIEKVRHNTSIPLLVIRAAHH
jgi:nucleotide-binding universal stress UspA family protein